MLRFDRVTKYFGGRTLFEQASLTVGSAVRVGVVGANGSGKSTLLRMAAGQLEPDSGQVWIAPGAAIQYLPQAIEAGECLSGGERQRAELERVLGACADLLLLDEPTNNLDEEAVEEVRNRLLSLSAAMLIVSHDRAFLNAVVEKIIELDPVTAAVTEYGGGWDDYFKKKRDDIDRQWRMYHAQQTKIAQLTQDIRETKNQAHHTENRTVNDYIRGRSKKVAAKAKARETRLNRIIAAEHKIEKPRHLPTIRVDLPAGKLQGKLLVEMMDAEVVLGQRSILRNVSLSLSGGQRAVITGCNGAGKSTLLKLIAGQFSASSGSLWLNRKARLCHLQQFSDHLPEDAVVIDWFMERLESFDVCPAHIAGIRTYLHRFLFAGDDVFKTIGQLSGGERVRLELATMMANAPDLILLDEPTNHLDLDSIASVEQALACYCGAIVAVSHDRKFRQSLRPDVVWRIGENTLTVSLPE